MNDWVSFLDEKGNVYHMRGMSIYLIGWEYCESPQSQCDERVHFQLGTVRGDIAVARETLVRVARELKVDLGSVPCRESKSRGVIVQ
jgi:hypothetical protein